MLVIGQNEAFDRLLKGKTEANHGGIDYPKATNDRGFMSSGGEREHHAEGDVVGDEDHDENARKMLEENQRPTYAME